MTDLIRDRTFFAEAYGQSITPVFRRTDTQHWQMVTYLIMPITASIAFARVYSAAGT